uniref:Elongator complex protein 5 n=1 Tax=Picea sitchensis TaxID=3332 RepID=B8LN16_PICSI|nr:unknown [Picea sitchensis]
MADSACRALRDGVLAGEHAPSLMISDSMHTTAGLSVFNYFLRSLVSNISSARAQAKGLVVVAFDRSPDFYVKLLARAGLDTYSHSWFQVLDCYTDPLGWQKEILDNVKSDIQETSEISKEHISHAGFTVCRDVGNMESLMSVILTSGKGAIGSQGKGRFSVAIDLVSIMVRHLSLPLVANLINNLRCHDEISSLMWLVHSDLHEPRIVTALEYLSSMVAVLEPIAPLSAASLKLKGDPDKLAALEGNLKKGKLRLRVKRRNGRVREHIEEFTLEQADVKFSAISHGKFAVSGSSNLPQVQFNLQLTEKEREDRARVILPFEHQGNGKELQIYDGRKGRSAWRASPVSDSHPVNTDPNFNAFDASKESGRGEIHYIRDSDDEALDSDEDPDDDLDI